MVRAPCCDQSMGLKKGPWTVEEDRILIAYVCRYGHGNWRALPREAGLLRCGKSCRLRWTNYLRPDIKRGNFTKEEEDKIISLHEMLGNRWSAIAARLPGRTDNEIKNVWHTHIKKRLKQKHGVQECDHVNYSEPEIFKVGSTESKPVSPPERSYGGISSSSSSSATSDFSSMSGENNNSSNNYITSSTESFDIDESFWSEALSMETELMPIKEPMIVPLISEQFCTVASTDDGREGMNFWMRILMETGDLGDLSEF